MLDNPEESTDQEDFDDGGIHMTADAILDACKEHHLSILPDLNETLYLYHIGFPSIRNLEPYINLKSIWLNNNSITKIENLSHLSNLTTLYLQNNFIEKIEGLDQLSLIDTLNLAHNYIEKVENLQNLTHLQSLDLERNRLKTAESLEGLTECPSIKILNLTGNGLSGDPEQILSVLARLPNLRVLRLDANPFVPNTPNYRRLVILKLPQLNYLDDEPIQENDRRLANAWIQGGKTAEREERAKIRAEKAAEEINDMKGLRKLQRERMLADGKKIEDFPE